MDIFGELKLLITTYHPKIKLGNEQLKEIRYSDDVEKVDVVQDRVEIVEEFKVSGGIKHKKAKKSAKKRSKKGENLLVNGSDPSKFCIPKKRNREYTCPFCQWIFPQNYSEEDMNRHAEMCIDGKGSDDIINYRSEAKKTKKRKKVKKGKNKQIDNTEQILSQYKEDNLENEEFEVCPYCELYIGELDSRFKEKHLMLCRHEQNSCIKKLNLI